MNYSAYAVAAIVSAAAAPSLAGIVSYTDRAQFYINTADQTETTPSVSFGFVQDLQIGNLVFRADTSGANAGNRVGVNEFTSVISGPDLALDFQSFSMQSADRNARPVSVFGMGFDVVEPTGNCGGPACVQSVFEIDVFDGLSMLASYTFAPDDDTLSFFGVAGDMAFDRFVIRETTGTNDDEYFGNFVTSSTAVPVAPVPLPASVFMFGFGLAGFAAFRKRKPSSKTV